MSKKTTGWLMVLFGAWELILLVFWAMGLLGVEIIPLKISAMALFLPFLIALLFIAAALLIFFIKAGIEEIRGNRGMSNHRDKLIRKTTRRLMGDRFRELLTVMLDSPLRVRVRYAAIIVFRLGRKELGGNRDNRKPA
jgi:hypothetical protein